jgi:hypothetical protein
LIKAFESELINREKQKMTNQPFRRKDQKVSMILSSRGLQNIISDENDFTFKVNGQCFRMSTFQAQFISPSVSNLIRSDRTAKEIEIEIDIDISRRGAEECFHHFLSLAKGKSITIASSEIDIFSKICFYLGNKELIELLFSNESPSLENIVFRLEMNLTDSDIGYACEHFISLDHSLFSVEILRILLSDSRLIIESEDWLLAILQTLISKDCSYDNLIDTIECQYLSQSKIVEFCELLNATSLSCLAWESICRRLCLEVHPSISNPRLRIAPERNLDFDSGKPFDGILFYLFEKCGRNPHHAGLITISAPDERTDRKFECPDLISYESKTGKWWATNNTNVPHYLRIDFKALQICPSAYSIKAHSSRWGNNSFVKSWEFEGSSDGSTWQCLDRHSNCTDLCRNDAVASYHISNSPVFRYLRFRMVGQNSSNDWQFSLQQIEIFGRLIGEST